jgi:flagellar motor switch protein FliG
MTTTAPQLDDRLRQAAVLVRSLDSDSVAALLARLSPSEAKTVRMAVRELDNVTEDDRQSVAEAMRRASSQKPVKVEPSGVEFQLPASAEQQRPTTQAAATQHAPSQSRLQKLGAADSEALVACLKLEQPATIATVLSCLPPQRAAEVLSQLPEQLQSHAVDHLAEMGEIDPDSLEVIAAELEVWIANHTQAKRRREDRVSSLRAILDATPQHARGRLAYQLGSRLPELQLATKPESREAATKNSASESSPRPRRIDHAPDDRSTRERAERAAAPTIPTPSVAPRFQFSRLESLPAPSLMEVFSLLDRKTLILALVGASDELMKRLRSVATRKQAAAIQQSIAAVGPVRLSDIRHAQQLVADAAALVVQKQRGV